MIHGAVLFHAVANGLRHINTYKSQGNLATHRTQNIHVMPCVHLVWSVCIYQVTTSLTSRAEHKATLHIQLKYWQGFLKHS